MFWEETNGFSDAFCQLKPSESHENLARRCLNWASFQPRPRRIRTAVPEKKRHNFCWFLFVWTILKWSGCFFYHFGGPRINIRKIFGWCRWNHPPVQRHLPCFEGTVNSDPNLQAVGEWRESRMTFAQSQTIRTTISIYTGLWFQAFAMNEILGESQEWLKKKGLLAERRLEEPAKAEGRRLPSNGMKIPLHIGKEHNWKLDMNGWFFMACKRKTE